MSLCSMAFHFPFEARRRRAMMKAWNMSTVSFHGSSRDLDKSSYATEPDLVDRSKGFSPVKGSRTIGCTGKAEAGVMLLTAPARVVMTAARHARSEGMLLQSTTRNKAIMTKYSN